MLPRAQGLQEYSALLKLKQIFERTAPWFQFGLFWGVSEGFVGAWVGVMQKVRHQEFEGQCESGPLAPAARVLGVHKPERNLHSLGGPGRVTRPLWASVSASGWSNTHPAGWLWGQRSSGLCVTGSLPASSACSVRNSSPPSLHPWLPDLCFLLRLMYVLLLSPVVKNPPAVQETQVRSLDGEDPPLEDGTQPTAVLLPGKFHGQRSLVGYSP